MILSGLVVLAAIGAAFWIGRRTEVYLSHPNMPKPISLTSPCPACGNLGCELHYDAQLKNVKRQCKTCACVVTQPVVYPDLFKN